MNTMILKVRLNIFIFICSFSYSLRDLFLNLVEYEVDDPSSIMIFLFTTVMSIHSKFGSLY